MEVRRSIALPISEPSQAAEARRLATAWARESGFSETEAGKVAIVASEAATNLVKHSRGGELLLCRVQDGSTPALDILALDKGPGITNVRDCLRDGYSTAGSHGTGLGAISRLSAVFDIHSVPAKGTVVFARLGSGAAIEAPRPLEVGAVIVPKAGEEVSGDAWAEQEAGGSLLVLLADGLGHGALAEEASTEAARVFKGLAEAGPSEAVHVVHAAVRSTRGAAVAVAAVDPGAGVVRYCGVGNISGAILSRTGVRHLVSHSGTAGHQMRKVQEFTYPWPADSVLVLNSDGLVSQWSLDDYPGILYCHPTLIAGVLYRDFSRGRDDVGVVVVKGASP